MKRKLSDTVLLLAVSLLFSCNSEPGRQGEYTRGIGLYPGNPAEYRGPVLRPDSTMTYRNLALRRMAFSSSSYDYNLTAQLATDGIIEEGMPSYLRLLTADGELKRNEREWMFDGKIDSKYAAMKNTAENFLRLDLANASPTVTRTSLRGYVLCNRAAPQGHRMVLEGSVDGVKWVMLAEEKGRQGYPASGERSMQPLNERQNRCYFDVDCRFAPTAFSHYRLSVDVPSAEEWNFTEWEFFNGEEKVLMTTQQYFKSDWMSLTAADEWIQVDLGTVAELDKVKLHWINKAVEGDIEISDDGKQWKTVARLPGGDAPVDECAIDGKGRFVRVAMKRSADGEPFVLTELEVFGRGGLLPVAQPQRLSTERRCDLSGGDWQLQRASQVAASGEALSTVGFDASDWVTATVPGTVFTSFINIGAVPDGNYGDDHLHISDAYFISNFWYRDEFVLPASFANKEVFLHFDGINWKANLFVNGTEVGRIEGAFMSARYDVTALLKPGEMNALAVEIIRNDNYGAVKEKTRRITDQNGGILGADNPTFHATIGWDWIPTVRGRNIGLWNDVYFTAHAGGVTLDEPFVTTDLPLPDTSYADIRAEILLTNHRAEPASGVLRFSYGEQEMRREVRIPALSAQRVTLEGIRMEHPKLWMPVGYGEPNLYPAEFSFVMQDGVTTDVKRFMSGIREMSYAVNEGALDFYVNGRRLIGNGGNWGFPEVNLNYRAREYDIAVAYHADMGFTMIRNWVGMTGDEEFYDACDRHGVMIWQDFWLANPWDGPDPDNTAMFMRNAEDYVKRIRNHPALALYVGRNEGYPPRALNEGLSALVKELHPQLTYIPHSAADGVSGEGPYCYQTAEASFGNPKGFSYFHSERGMPNVMTYESMMQMLPEKERWPQTNVWGMHDYTLAGAQKSQLFNEAVEKAFGEPAGMKEFCEWAQWINYEGYRGMFEARSAHRKGLLLWMSHSCWPSMTWDTYDYYFEPSAAYFACKKGAAPLRIQWNPVSGFAEVVNLCVPDKSGLTATAQIIKTDGTVVFERRAETESREDSTVPVFSLPLDSLPDWGEVCFIKFRLFQKDSLLADNFYWLGRDPGNYRALRQMAKAKVKRSVTVEEQGNEWRLRAVLKNESSVPALMLRLKAVGRQSGERILPVWYGDNYFSLMPGEQKSVTVKMRSEDMRGEKPALVLSGFNLY